LALTETSLHVYKICFSTKLKFLYTSSINAEWLKARTIKKCDWFSKCCHRNV